MTNNDMIYLTTDWDIEQAVKSFLGYIGNASDVFVRKGKLSKTLAFGGTNTFRVDATPLEPEDLASLVERFGIAPTIEMSFDLADEHIVAAREEIFKAILELIHNTDWDLALEQGEIILLRKSGQLMLKSGAWFWTPEHLRKIEIPYTMKSTLRLQ